MSSLRDQLLKAGLVTEEQVEKAAIKPKRYTSSQKVKRPPQKQNNNKNKRPKKELTDLEKFYRQRSSVENKERQQAKKAKEEATQRKKERNTKISRLINENMFKVDNASERYNFLVGTAVKYLYVSEEQLQQLADGKLALTFLKGKCRIISVETAAKIREIDKNRLIIQQKVAAD
jgi:uncharacterized protein YaiL (DUF2058 family)